MCSVTTLITVFLAITATMTASAYAEDKPALNALELYFFGSATCECFEIKESLLKPMEKKHGDRLKIHYHNWEDSSSFKLMKQMDTQYKVEKFASQELFFPDTFLLGYESIMANGRAMIEEYLNDPQRRLSIEITEQTTGRTSEVYKAEFDKLNLVGIIPAAIADSVNPCAIATLIFLLSFLTTQKRKRLEILIIGLIYTATVFVTYTLLGAGAFVAITSLGKVYKLAHEIIKWSAVAFAAIVGILSLLDAIRFKKSGDAKEIKLQLPKSVKLRIHKIITDNMKGSRLVIGTIVTGFLVTLLEAACTGQVYLPVIVGMTRHGQDGLKLIGWLLLMLYNLIFVLPLLAVMVAAYYGMKWTDLSKMMQKHLTLLKVLMGIVMIGLALYLAFA
jgi:cytochrome c biogenesis protein CcdA